MEFNVKADVEAVKRALNHVHDDVVDRAAISTLNRIGAQVRTEAVRQVSRRRNLRMSYIRSEIGQRKASRAFMATVVSAVGFPVVLNEYGAHNTRAGVTVKVMRDGPRKLVHRYGNKAFAFSRGRPARRGSVQTMPIMVRRGRSRLPIQKLYGPSVPTAFMKRTVTDAFKRLAEQKWPARFEHELKFRLEKLGFDVRGL